MRICIKRFASWLVRLEGAALPDLKIVATGLTNVQFLPLQPLEKLNDLLNTADIHILPQRADAADLVMPSKLSGMLTSGKAVVATAAPESELGSIVSAVGLLTPPGDAAQLAEALLGLARNPGQRAVLGEKGRNWVLSHWTREKVLRAFEAGLETMIKS